ncbi:hypothetical protein ACSBR1_005968 [Camellia fascicularis]
MKMGSRERKRAREQGGWRPVIRTRRGALDYGGKEDEIFTIFVDNLPESMTSKDLLMLFTKFRVVKDVFIPMKRRKQTGSRFGFVRYGCRVSMAVAVQKANGIWLENKELIVKKADFDKVNQNKVQRMEIKRKPIMKADGVSQIDKSQAPKPLVEGMSFADIVKSGDNQRRNEVTIQAKEIGNGWLYESLIVKLKSFGDFEEFKKEFHKREGKDVQVRAGGGKTSSAIFQNCARYAERQNQFEEMDF